MGDRVFSLLWICARIFVGLVFAYAGLAKLLEPSANFEAALLRYGVFSPAWIPWIAQIVPWLEWLLGSLTVVGYSPRLASAGISLLSLAFLVTLGSSGLLLEAGQIDCGCFGRSGLHLSVRQIFLVDLVSFAVSLGFLVKKTQGKDDIKAKGFEK